MIAPLETQMASFTSHIKCPIKLYKHLLNKKSVVSSVNVSAEGGILLSFSEPIQIDKTK